jgi:hypothetical protein
MYQQINVWMPGCHLNAGCSRRSVFEDQCLAEGEQCRRTDLSSDLKKNSDLSSDLSSDLKSTVEDQCLVEGE